MASSHHLCFFLHAKQRLYDQTSSLYGSQTSSVVLSTHNSVLSTRIKRQYWFQPSPVVLCMHNSDFWTRITSLYGSQTSPVLLCMQNSDFWTRITSLYGSQTSPVVLCMHYSVIITRIIVSMGPNPYLWFLHAKQRLLDQNNKSLWVPDLTCRFVHALQRNYHQNYCIYGSHPLSVDFAFITATFGAELQVSMGPRPHLSFCACKKP